MPITPFHGGIGLACKGPLGPQFSFAVFTATQVVIDLESGYFLATGGWPVHRFLHTLVGATIAAVAVAVLLRRPCEWAVRKCGAILGSHVPAWLDLNGRITVGTALLSAFAGVLGHVVPDAIMHSDARPFAPFSEANPLLGLVSLTTLHLGLVLLGCVGAAWMVAAGARGERSN